MNKQTTGGGFYALATKNELIDGLQKCEKRVKEFEGYTKCSRCGDYFNKKDLSRVLAHEECPVMSVNYESKRIK